jgi:RNA polymerase sigma-70 factor (ECF subfamily)
MVPARALDDEAELLAGLRARDDEAYGDLVRRYRRRLSAVARRLLANEEDVADAVQDTFVSFFRSIESFTGQSGLWTWLYRIVWNGCLTRLRYRTRHPALSLDALPPTTPDAFERTPAGARRSEDPYHALARAELRAHVRASIECLPGTLRTVLWLRDIQELDTDETAAALRMSPGAVKTCLCRARRALREMLEPAAGCSRGLLHEDRSR